ncbi:esterase-like activity of phytase family protein [Pinibacter soli]|uniref:Esterase-like activity of phytase family protein n=1 Tax=Pinibacter soli TaxID=3044211 RepID=A0ABT6RIV7_9BACT|nr:esterase-like activity of phytase family protein [Pinibacter soli]MDI3322320.1 esterase-like activity of phytase family protein [Pinibacter soli]
MKSILTALIFLFACAANAQTIKKLTFLSEFDIPYNFQFQNTTVGGLSGIDYNPKANEYYLICDDRAVINPIRFYTAKINLKAGKIDTALFISQTELRQPNGALYPSLSTDPAHAPDPEAIRFNSAKKYFVWTSEGERIIKDGNAILQDPAIIIIDSNGKDIGHFPLPKQFQMSKDEKGPRQNGAFEGVCFTDNSKTMYVTTEVPLYQDGPPAGLKDTSAYVRILKYDVDNKKLLAQYAYKLSSIAHAPKPEDGFKVNGIVDILPIGADEFMITERSFSTGVKNCTIKVFKCNFQTASDITNVQSLKVNRPKMPVKKQLLLDMDSLNIYIDNVEGATFGPRLSNGKRSMIFVSDNDFHSDRKTQFLLFQVD